MTSYKEQQELLWSSKDLFADVPGAQYARVDGVWWARYSRVWGKAHWKAFEQKGGWESDVRYLQEARPEHLVEIVMQLLLQ